MSASVLYVDDDRSLCQLVSKALVSEGYSVRTCPDGDEADAVLAEQPPDLLLLDLTLSGRDGFEVLAALRAGESTPDLPVVLLSDTAPTPTQAQRANQLGALDLLEKPVPLERLIEVVARCIGSKKKAVPLREKRETPASRRSASGTFERVSFPALLHHLHGMRATGVLHLSHEKKRKWLQLSDGHVEAVRSNLVSETLGRHLLRSSRITKAQLEESRRQAKKTSKRHGEILVAMDLLSEDDVADALREQADEKFFEIFSWPDGSFRFERGSRLQRANALGGGRSPANRILEGVSARFPIERIDRYFEVHAARTLTHGESPFYRFQDIRIDPTYDSLLRGIDGAQKLRDFREEEESLRRLVYGLLATGMLELGSASGKRTASRAPTQAAEAEARPAASDAAADSRSEDPRHLELVELAAQLDADDPHRVLGVERGADDAQLRAAYEALAARTHPDRFHDGSMALRELADEVFGRVRTAFETLSDPRERQLLEIENKKLEREEATRRRSERTFQAEVEHRNGEDAIAARNYETALVHFGKALELYPDEGNHHASYGYALHLCHPGDPGMIAEAIEHVKRGLKLASHREKPYLYLGRLHKAVGRVEDAERMFIRAVQIDPDCMEAIRELRVIQMRREKSKSLIGRLFRR